MSTETSLPTEFNDIISQLNNLNERGKTISTKVSGLSSVSKQAKESLRSLLNKTSQLSELIKNLKRSILELKAINDELQSKLNTTTNEYETKSELLKSQQTSQMQELSEKYEKLKEELEKSLLSESEKEAELERLKQQARTSEDALNATHTEEKQKILEEFSRLNAVLLRQLSNIATNQAVVIESIEAAISDRDSDAITRNLVDIQNQIVSLSEAINIELGQEQPPPPQEPGILQQIENTIFPSENTSPSEDLSNYKAPNIDFNDLSILRTVSINSGTDNNIIFEYMLKTLYLDNKNNKISNNNMTGPYNQLMETFDEWKRNSENSNTDVEILSKLKQDTYDLLEQLFNTIYDQNKIRFNRTSDNKIGGQKTRNTRKHRKVHFKTRGKKGGKKRKGTKHHKGKKSHTKKH